MITDVIIPIPKTKSFSDAPRIPMIKKQQENYFLSQHRWFDLITKLSKNELKERYNALNRNINVNFEHILYDDFESQVEKAIERSKGYNPYPDRTYFKYPFETWLSHFYQLDDLISYYNRPNTSTSEKEYYNLVNCIVASSKDGNSYILKTNEHHHFNVDFPSKSQKTKWKDKVMEVRKRESERLGVTPTPALKLAYLYSHKHMDHYNKEILATPKTFTYHLYQPEFQYFKPGEGIYSTQGQIDDFELINLTTRDESKPMLFEVLHSHVEKISKDLLKIDPGLKVNAKGLVHIKNYAILDKNMLYITDTGDFSLQYLDYFLSQSWDYPYFVLLIEKNYCSHIDNEVKMAIDDFKRKVLERSEQVDGHMNCETTIKLIHKFSQMKNSKGELLPIKYVFLHKSTSNIHDDCPFEMIKFHSTFDTYFYLDVKNDDYQENVMKISEQLPKLTKQDWQIIKDFESRDDKNLDYKFEDESFESKRVETYGGQINRRISTTFNKSSKFNNEDLAFTFEEDEW